MDGTETLRRLREKSDLPVNFLTSKEEEIDELFGLKMGAEDYIESRSHSGFWRSGCGSRCCVAAAATRPLRRRRNPTLPRCWTAASSAWSRKNTSAPGRVNRSP